MHGVFTVLSVTEWLYNNNDITSLLIFYTSKSVESETTYTIYVHI